MRSLVLAAIAILLATSCARAPLFTEATALRIVSPGELTVVETPITLRWQASGLTPGTRFAVFVDRAPVHPGQSLRAVTNLSCHHTAGCPDAAELATYGVLLTSGDAVTIEDVPQPSGLASVDTPPVHRATVVLIDPSGHRLGESAYSVDFRVPPSSL